VQHEQCSTTAASACCSELQPVHSDAQLDRIMNPVILLFPELTPSCAGTLVAPPLAQMGILSLCVSRAVVGLGEGFAPSAVTHVMATLVPASERSRAVSYVFGGLDLGSVIGLLLCGPLIAKFGWPSVFYVFGIVGLAWGVIWPLCKPTKVDPLVQKMQELLVIQDEQKRQENAEASGKQYVAKDSKEPVRLLAHYHAFAKIQGNILIILICWQLQ
jgi:MFS transporter, ACS family, solute carrier family 17 (sodium-dependent inorganic phosphate cotransporter), other